MPPTFPALSWAYPGRRCWWRSKQYKKRMDPARDRKRINRNGSGCRWSERMKPGGVVPIFPRLPEIDIFFTILRFLPYIYRQSLAIPGYCEFVVNPVNYFTMSRRSALILQFALCIFEFAICILHFAVGGFEFAFCNLQFAFCCRSPVCNLQFAFASRAVGGERLACVDLASASENGKPLAWVRSYTAAEGGDFRICTSAYMLYQQKKYTICIFFNIIYMGKGLAQCILHRAVLAQHFFQESSCTALSPGACLHSATVIRNFYAHFC